MFKFRPVFMAEEGLDTSTFFGGQDVIDEATLPDAGSAELLENAPEPGAVDQLPEDGDEADPGKAEQPATKGRKQYVPLGALQEERAARQAEREENRILQERLNQFLQLQQQQMQATQQQQQQQPQVPEIPAFVDDPEGHVKALTQQFNQLLEEQRTQIQQLSGHSQATQAQQQLAVEVGAAETAFRATEPSYDAALQHFNAVKIAEYMAFGYSESQARQQLARDYQGVAIGAKQNNRNPAEVMFGIAKALGFNPQQQQQQQQQQPPVKKAPTSLSTLPAAGRAPDEKGPLSAKQVAAMSNEEFDQFFNEMAKNSVQRPAF